MTQTNPTQAAWEDRCRDCDDTGTTIQTERRCACQPPLTQTNPEQWAVELGQQIFQTVHDNVPNRAVLSNAIALYIQAAFAEREARYIAMEKRARDLSVMIVNHLGGGSEWFSQVGDEYYADPNAIGPELQRRKTDTQITKTALVRANKASAEQVEREAQMAAVLGIFGKVLPSAAGLNDAPDSKIIACYMSMGELRAIKATLAALKDRTDG